VSGGVGRACLDLRGVRCVCVCVAAVLESARTTPAAASVDDLTESEPVVAFDAAGLVARAAGSALLVEAGPAESDGAGLW